MISGDWAELNPDLLDEIAKFIYCYDDYVQFRAVCKHWNTSLPKIPNHHNPWLVLPLDGDKPKTLLSPLAEQKKIYHMILPEFQTTKLRGSSFGWLIGLGIDGTVRMLNPFNKKHIDLPPLSTFPDVVSYNPDPEQQGHDHDDDDDDTEAEEEYTIRDIGDEENDSYTVSRDHMQMVHVKKVILSSAPPDDDGNNNNNKDFIAIALYGTSYSRLAFCRLGDKKWTDLPKSATVPVPDIECAEYGYEDAIFHDGKIYVINFFAQLFEYDMKATSYMVRLVEAPKPPDLYIPWANHNVEYLIGCPDGGLLMVVRHLKFNMNPDPKAIPYPITSRFSIYKLKKGATQWSRDFNLESCVLVIGFNSSTWMSLGHTSPKGWGNRILYTDNILDPQYSRTVGGHDIGIFNLEDGKFTQLFPNITLLSSPPIWLL
ncbi:hypothetical protein RIF29_21992 [Crotalaria pallida]|uniref:KIB1-4 beta-propeller domain-containing protein n=1 Tax=Crotalaria pallida TaxID=3830 RepID=A0AAN9F6B5_CROPI